MSLPFTKTCFPFVNGAFVVEFEMFCCLLFACYDKNITFLFSL